MRNRPLAMLVLAATAALTGTAAAGEPAAPASHADELKAQVPALRDFHEVIFPLWHEAWPEKNVAMMKDLLPKVRDHAARVEKAELPGILRDRKGAWDEGVKALAGIVARYEKAAAAEDEQGLLDAVEALHSQFEKLVRIVRPATKELDAYHVELYQAYHHFMPVKDLAKVREAAARMTGRCDALVAAPVPARFMGREAELRKAFEALCADTRAFQETAKGEDAAKAAAALESVHDRYRKTEALFE